MVSIVCSMRSRHLLATGSRIDARRRQLEPRRSALEQRAADQVLEAGDMAAHRALRDGERLCARREAHVPSHRLERAQSVQRQPAAVDEAIRRDLGFSVAFLHFALLHRSTSIRRCPSRTRLAP